MSHFARSYAWAAIVLVGLLSVSVCAAASNDSLVGSTPIVTILSVVADPKTEVPRIDRSNIASATGADLLGAPISLNLTNEDAAIAERLRELIATELVHRVDNRDRAAVEAFYRDRGFAPLWIANSSPTVRANDAVAFLGGVEDDALDPADYPTPNFAGNAPESLAEDEIKLTNSILVYARDAQTGRVSYTRVSKNISYDLQPPQPGDVLNKMAAINDIRQVLNSYNPQQSGYKALKAKLVNELDRLRNGTTADRVSERPTLRPEASRKVGTRLGGKVRVRSRTIDKITANMERWRWLPRDLGDAFVMVNIPEYSLKVVDHGRTVWTTRIVVGKLGAAETPLLSENLKSITINPTWSVPQSIIRKEYLPALRENPEALSRSGLRVGRNQDGSLRIYQPPGDSNALGHLRFNFPNKFLVYQHDTPTKYLFARNQRAFSHGCIRVQNPETYAEVLLTISQPMENYTADRIRRSFGVVERNISLKIPIPVHVTYQTAFVDDAGNLQIREDVYGLDKLILDALGRGRNLAGAPIVRNYN